MVANQSVLPSPARVTGSNNGARKRPIIDQGGRHGETSIKAPNHLDFKVVEILIVSGDGPNVFGHSLLHVDGAVFHIDGVYQRPVFFPMAYFSQWLEDTGKQLLRQMRVDVPKKSAANRRLQGLFKKKWLWGLVPHNCVAFIEEVLEAGGADYSCWTNLPTLCPTPERRAFPLDETL